MNRTKQKTPSQATAPEKYYRVVLEAIDPHKETKESFALKLAMQTRTPITRINTIVKNMPHVVRSGLSMDQAKKFSTVLEELGGITTLVEYEMKAGEVHPEPGGLAPAGRTDGSDLSLAGSRGLKSDGGQRIVCPSCGWENSGEVDFCAFCFAGFQSRPEGTEILVDRLPEENPLIEKTDSKDRNESSPPKKSISKSHLFILGALLILVIWFLTRL